MNFTYNSSLINSNTKDWVRWRVGDTSTSDQLQHDEEISAAVSNFGNKYAGAAAVARAIAGKFAREPDSKMGQVAFSNSQKSQAFLALAKTIDLEAASEGITGPWMGASSVAWKDSQEEDEDRVQPSFARGQFDPEGVSLTAETGSTSL